MQKSLLDPAVFYIAHPIKLTNFCPHRCASNWPLHRVAYPSKQQHLLLEVKYQRKNIIIVARARQFCYAAHTQGHTTAFKIPQICPNNTPLRFVYYSTEKRLTTMKYDDTASNIVTSCVAFAKTLKSGQTTPQPPPPPPPSLAPRRRNCHEPEKCKQKCTQTQGNNTLQPGRQ